MITISNLAKIDNSLDMTLLIPRKGSQSYRVSSSEINFCGVLGILFECTTFADHEANTTLRAPYKYQQIISMTSSKKFHCDKLTYIIKFSSNAKEEIASQIILGNDAATSIRVLLRQSDQILDKFDVKLTLEVHSECLFPSLYEDSDFADFQLCGENGSVQVHKLVLINSSPVLRSLLSGNWKEAKLGFVEIPKFTQEDLQRFKEYLYLKKVSDYGVEQLAELASYYMISDLKQRCALKLICTLTAYNVASRMQLALKLNLKTLLLAILHAVKAGDISIEDIDQCCHDDSNDDVWAVLPFSPK